MLVVGGLCQRDWGYVKLAQDDTADANANANANAKNITWTIGLITQGASRLTGT